MLDVIHLIVTILSDQPSFEWECNVKGRPIWFRLLMLTFSTCFHVVVAQQWHGRDAVWGFDKRTVLWIDWVVLTSYFYGSHKGSEKAQLLYAGCVHFTVDWLFWNLYGSYIVPRPLLSWKKPGHFSFDNMGPLSCKLWAKHYLEFPIRGKDADPSVIIISYNNVSIGVDCHSCWPLQLSWRTTPDTEARFELPIIGKNLHKNKQIIQFSTKCNKPLSMCLYWF